MKNRLSPIPFSPQVCEVTGCIVMAAAAADDFQDAGFVFLFFPAIKNLNVA